MDLHWMVRKAELFLQSSALTIRCDFGSFWKEIPVEAPDIKPKHFLTHVGLQGSLTLDLKQAEDGGSNMP